MPGVGLQSGDPDAVGAALLRREITERTTRTPQRAEREQLHSDLGLLADAVRMIEAKTTEAAQEEFLVDVRAAYGRIRAFIKKHQLETREAFASLLHSRAGVCWAVGVSVWDNWERLGRFFGMSKGAL